MLKFVGNNAVFVSVGFSGLRPRARPLLHLPAGPNRRKSCLTKDWYANMQLSVVAELLLLLGYLGV